VHYFAGYLASLEGRYGEAEGRARAALRLQPRYDDAQELLASVLYRTGRYAEVVDVCDERIARDRSLPGAWYLRSLALRRLGKVEEALRSAQTGLQVAPEDEVFRAFAEGIVLAELPFEDARRGRWAAYHVERAPRLRAEKPVGPSPLRVPPRLEGEPYDVASRRAYAKLLLTRGYPARHLDQLKFIQTLGKSTSEVNDAVENYEKLLQGSLPKKWKVDPSTSTSRTRASVFTIRQTRETCGIRTRSG
jgi:tetratricopeptide (TPR) repeat protein